MSITYNQDEDDEERNGSSDYDDLRGQLRDAQANFRRELSLLRGELGRRTEDLRRRVDEVERRGWAPPPMPPPAPATAAPSSAGTEDEGLSRFDRGMRSLRAELVTLAENIARVEDAAWKRDDR